MEIHGDFMGFHGISLGLGRSYRLGSNFRDFVQSTGLLGDILSVYHQTGWFPQSIKFPVKVVSSKLFTRALRSIWIYLNR